MNQGPRRTKALDGPKHLNAHENQICKNWNSTTTSMLNAKSMHSYGSFWTLKNLLTMTDAFTKYAEIVTIPNKEAATVADAIFTKHICRYGWLISAKKQMSKLKIQLRE